MSEMNWPIILYIVGFLNDSAEKHDSSAPASLSQISSVNMKKVGNKYLVNDVYRHENMI